jgi:transcriptional regulator with XRE-family HTH domain
MSQRALADVLFISQQSVGKWESGLSTPTPDMIVKVANYFSVSTDYLLGVTDVPSSNPVNMLHSDPKISRINEMLNSLDSTGLQRVVDYAEDLVASQRYNKNDSACTPEAM